MNIEPVGRVMCFEHPAVALALGNVPEHGNDKPAIAAGKSGAVGNGKNRPAKRIPDYGSVAHPFGFFAQSTVHITVFTIHF